MSDYSDTPFEQAVALEGAKLDGEVKAAEAQYLGVVRRLTDVNLIAIQKVAASEMRRRAKSREAAMTDAERATIERIKSARLRRGL